MSIADECDHTLNPDSTKIINRSEEAVEVEGFCQECPTRLYERIPVGRMCSYERTEVAR